MYILWDLPQGFQDHLSAQFWLIENISSATTGVPCSKILPTCSVSRQEKDPTLALRQISCSKGHCLGAFGSDKATFPIVWYCRSRFLKCGEPEFFRVWKTTKNNLQAFQCKTASYQLHLRAISCQTWSSPAPQRIPDQTSVKSLAVPLGPAMTRRHKNGHESVIEIRAILQISWEERSCQLLGAFDCIKKMMKRDAPMSFEERGL